MPITNILTEIIYKSLNLHQDQWLFVQKQAGMHKEEAKTKHSRAPLAAATLCTLMASYNHCLYIDRYRELARRTRRPANNQRGTKIQNGL